MKKLTKVDVKRMCKKDKEHLIFDGKNGLTKRLSIQQIEAIFPDSLLILTDIVYDVDSDGNLCIVSAVVDEFCETTQEAADYINENYSSFLESGTPYHTGVTKFNHEKCLTYVGNPNFSQTIKEETSSFVKQEQAFPFSSIGTEINQYCSIKELNYEPLYNFLSSLISSEVSVKELIQSIEYAVNNIPATELGTDIFVEVVNKSLTQMGYQPTEHFDTKLKKLIKEHYSRLYKRDKAVIFYSGDDKKFLTEYCTINQDKFFYMKSDRFIDLLFAILQNKLRKIVLTDRTIEKMSVVKAKTLGMLAVKCEIKIEIISE